MWANLHNYWDMAQDSWRASRWGDKLRVWFMHPGWRPADVAARWPKQPFDITQVSLYNPPISKGAAWAAVGLFVVALNATTWFLWNSHTLTLGQQAAAAGGIVAVLWLVGVICTPRGVAAARGSRLSPG